MEGIVVTFVIYSGIFFLTMKWHKNYGLERWLIERYPLRELIKKDENLNTIQQLYLTKKDYEQLKLHWCKKLRAAELILGVFLALGMVSLLMERGEGKILNPDNSINRPQYGEGEKEIALDLFIEGISENRVDITVPEREYGKEELEDAFDKARQYIREAVLGENDSLSKVDHNLNLAFGIPDSGIRIEWITDDRDFIERDGTVRWESIEEETEAVITGVLIYGERKEEVPIQVTLIPKEISEEEELLMEWEAALEEKKGETSQEEYLFLPQEILGKKVIYEEPKKHESSIFIIFGLAGAILGACAIDRRLSKKGKEREEQLLFDYPVLVNRFVLLLGAGMTITGAWERIVKQYMEKKKKGSSRMHYAYEEMVITWQEMTNGVSEVKALEGYGKRIRILEYLKFSTLLSQNLRKGSQGILELLEMEAIEAFEKRKEYAKQKGEEAGTKLLMPMMLMLIMVMAVILVPAFMTI